MAEIRNLTRNGETFYPLTHVEAVLDPDGEYIGNYTENPEFVYVKTNKDDKILWAIKTDGSIYYGAGVPQQVIEYVEEKLTELSLDEYENIVAFLTDYLGSDTTLKTMIDGINAQIDNKLDADGLEPNALSSIKTVENLEYLQVTKDSEDKILAGRTPDGAAFENVGFATPKMSINGHTIENIEDLEGRSEITKDAEGKILSYRKKDGTKVELAGLEIKPNNFDFFPTNKYLPIMANLKRREIVRSTGTMGDYETFTLACLTDTHADDDAVINFINFRKKYADYIDDAYINGDLIVDNFTKPYTHQNINGYDKILLGIGNHDVYTADWHSLSDVVSEQEAYNRYFANDIAKWGVTYTQGKTYYYKDYPRAKVRFVVLDCMYWDSTQKTWFTNILGDTINSSNPAFGYHVIVAQHIPNAHDTSELIPFDCSFNSKDDISVYHCAYYDSVEVVDEFINQGGVFIAWLFGHWHADFVGTFADYHNQMLIVQNVSSGTYNEQQGWTDTARIENTESRNQFNVYSVDTTKKYLRIARIGAEYDRNLQHKGTLLLSYDSENIRVLANY